MKKLFVAFVLILPFVNYAQDWTYVNRTSTTTGLCDAYLRDIAIDPEGSLWFVARSGISRFNGEEWTTFYAQDHYPGFFLEAVVVDLNGDKWFGGSRGVSVFNGSGWIDYTTADGLVSNYVQALAIDAQGIKWMGTLYGVSRFDGNTWTTYTKYDGLVDNNVYCIASDPNGNTWFGTMKGVSKYDGSNWMTYLKADGLASDSVYDIMADGNGDIWFATWNGVSRYDGTQWTTYKVADGLASNRVASIAIDGEGNYWFGTFGYGVSVFNGTSWITYTTEDGLIGNGVYAIEFDQSGNRWFGTGSGVSEFDGTEWYDYTPHPGLVSDTVGPMAVDMQGNAWIASGGMCKFDGQEWTAYGVNNGLISGNVKDIMVDGEDNVWVGTSQGVSVYNGLQWVSYTTENGLVNQYVEDLDYDLSGSIWMATHGGVSKLSNGIWSTFTVEDGLVSNYLYSVACDRNNILWFGSNNQGLSRFDGSDWETYTIDNGLISNVIRTLAVDNDNRLWAGTNSGISVFDGFSWTSYDETSGLEANNIYSILFDADNIAWVGSDNGIFKFDGASWSKIELEGGSIYWTSAMIDLEGNKWFGVWAGIAVLHDFGAGPQVFEKRLTGYAFLDDNINGQFDEGEVKLPNQQVRVDSNITITRADGNFAARLPIGNHTVAFPAAPYWYLTTPGTINLEVTTTTILDTLAFGVTPVPGVYDVNLFMVSTRTRVNTGSTYWINICNPSGYPAEGRLEVFLDTLVAWQSSDPVPDTVQDNRVVFNFFDLLPGEVRQFTIQAMNPGTEFIGDTLVMTGSVTISENDLFPEDNFDTLKSVLTGSMDPNDKLVKEGEGPAGYVLHGTDLTYTIRFQNTGNDTAFFVAIRDTLDERLDMSTFKMLASSYPARLEFRNNREATFYFDGLQLPDSAVNQEASCGYLMFRISPKAGLEDNTVVKNRAYITFDYNQAIATNEVTNTYVSTIPDWFAVPEVNTTQPVVIYPNPGKGIFTVDFGRTVLGKVDITVYDHLGRQVMEKRINGLAAGPLYKLDLSAAVPGIYFIRFTTGKEKFSKKVVIIR